MPEEEKPEYLKREEIRTMEKDIARLRELEAQRERERIAALKPKEEIKKEEVVTPPPKKEVPVTLVPKPPKGPSPFTKILVRVILALIIFLFLGFFYWFFAIKKPPTEVVIPPVEEEIIPPEEEKPEIIIPPSLIPVRETKTPEVSEKEEIPAVFSQLMAEELPEGTFTRIAIKNISENRLVSLEDFSQVFQVETPAEFFQKLESDYTLAIYPQKQGKRGVLIAKTKEPLTDLLKDWEKKIEKEGVFLSGQKIPALVPYFRTSFHQGVGFRYLTISREDLGICYAWFNNYFIFTTSFESLKRVIDEIKSEELKEKIGQIFIIGFEGKTLTPELENFFKKYRPGGVLLLSKNIENEEQLKSLISDLQNLSQRETGLPLFITVDQEGGLISRVGFLEEKTPQAEIKNIEEAYQVGLKRGQELKELGINLNLAPVLDLASEGDFLFNRSFQKTPGEVGELAKNLISGQKAAGILTTIKHFPGYGGITFNPEEELATLDLIPEISQFKKAIEANPEFIMASNVIYQDLNPSLPFTFSREGVQFLKNNLGPEILMISDDLDQNSLLNNFSLKEIVTKPLEAGIDILIFSGYRLTAEEGLAVFFEAVKNREISKEIINTAISRIINLKEKMLK